MTAAPKADAEVNELVLHTTPRVNRFEEKAGFGLVNDYYAIASAPVDLNSVVAPADVIDLTARMKPDGSIDWTPPEGQWAILRLGYSLTGTTTHPATAEATGLEVDKARCRGCKGVHRQVFGHLSRSRGTAACGSSWREGTSH